MMRKFLAGLILLIGLPAQAAFWDLHVAGDWDATTNIPKLQSSQGEEGLGYRVSNSGTTCLDSLCSWNANDIIYFDHSQKWRRLLGSNSGTAAGGTSGQVQYNNSGSFGGFTVSGDGTLNTATGALAVSKTGGVAFGSLATATPGTGVLTAVGVAANANGGVTLVSGAITVGNCVKWSASGIVDAGACGGGGGTITVPNGGTGQVSFSANLPILGNGASALAQGTRSGNTTAFATVSGTLTNTHCVAIDASGNLVDAGQACASGANGLNDIQVLTSSGTYTTPSGATRLHIRMVGGGGGGAGSTNGGTGGNSTFGTTFLVANGGVGAVTSDNYGGAGGTASGCTYSYQGQGGNPPYVAVSSAVGGNGGSSIFGAGGRGAFSPSVLKAGQAATGFGAGGGGYADGTNPAAGPGGGAGGECEHWVTSSLSATYSYVVGAAGTAGTSAGAGVAGTIVVESYK